MACDDFPTYCPPPRRNDYQIHSSNISPVITDVTENRFPGSCSKIILPELFPAIAFQESLLVLSSYAPHTSALQGPQKKMKMLEIPTMRIVELKIFLRLQLFEGATEVTADFLHHGSAAVQPVFPFKLGVLDNDEAEGRLAPEMGTTHGVNHTERQEWGDVALPLRSGRGRASEWRETRPRFQATPWKSIPSKVFQVNTLPIFR